MVVLLSLALSALTSASLLFQPFKPEQIPTDEISSLYQDSDGYIWIVSYSGLARYDGYRTELYALGKTMVKAVVSLIFLLMSIKEQSLVIVARMEVVRPQP